MTKNVVTVTGKTMQDMLGELERLGYRLQNPDTQDVIGFRSDGSGPEPLSTAGVSEFLIEGNGVLVWRGSDNSLYVSLISGKPRIVLDGLSSAEELSLQESLTAIGVEHSVAHEDIAYEA